MTAIGFEDHNHSHCINDAVTAVDAACKANGLQLTPVRRRTLEILLEEHRALGAYDVLARLATDGFGSQPPVAYRALDFLTTHGFAHKIEKLNAFTACAQPGDHHTPAFLICTECNNVVETEIDTTAGYFAQLSATTGFKIERAVLEADGLCPKCQDLKAQPDK